MTENLREAIEGYLKSLEKHGEPVPPSILEEVRVPGKSSRTSAQEGM